MDYVHDEDGGSWHRVLRNPKYAVWVAKVVVFTMMQYGLLLVTEDDAGEEVEETLEEEVVDE